MNKAWNCACLLAIFSATSLRADTLFSPGSITIGTNQAILITSMNDAAVQMKLDGQEIYFYDAEQTVDPLFAIAGKHTLSFDQALHNVGNYGFITYQLLNNSVIRSTIFTNANGYGNPFAASNSIYVPVGKTIQFFLQ